MNPKFTPAVGENWLMKVPTTMAKRTDTVEVQIVEELPTGWKVESESGWTGMGAVFGREWFITPVLN